MQQLQGIQNILNEIQATKSCFTVYCGLEFIHDGIFCKYLRMFKIAKKCDCTKFRRLYSVYSRDEFSPKCFSCKNFSVKVSWHCHKYFSAQNNSSLQYSISQPVYVSPLIISTLCSIMSCVLVDRNELDVSESQREFIYVCWSGRALPESERKPICLEAQPLWY